MSMRTCCGNDDHKGHAFDCPRKKELEKHFRERNESSVRQTDLREKSDSKNRKHRSKK